MSHLALIGSQELLVILGILLLVFGSKKLPELARSLGSSVQEFRRGLKEPEQQQLESPKADPTEPPHDGGGRNAA